MSDERILKNYKFVSVECGLRYVVKFILLLYTSFIFMVLYSLVVPTKYKIFMGFFIWLSCSICILSFVVSIELQIVVHSVNMELVCISAQCTY